MLSTWTFVAALTISQPKLTDANFEAIKNEIVPSADELRWRSIPWRPTLFEGVQDAQREGKPVFLYVMNGHPLGCT